MNSVFAHARPRLLVLPLSHRVRVVVLLRIFHKLARRVELRVDHPVRKLLWVTQERLLLQRVNQSLLLVKMLRSLLKVLLLLKDTEPKIRDGITKGGERTSCGTRAGVFPCAPSA